MLTGSIRLGRTKQGGTWVLPRFPDGDNQYQPGPDEVPEEDSVRFRLGKDVEFWASHSMAAVHVQIDDEAVPSEWSRKAGARLFRAMQGQDPLRELQLAVPEDPRFDLEAFFEGFLLASYQFRDFLTSSAPTPTVLHVPQKNKAVEAQLRVATDLVVSTIKVRNLVNRPANCLYPESFIDELKPFTKIPGVKLKVHRGAALEKGFPCLHAVGRGSIRPPLVAELTYKPKGRDLPHVVLCGKGVTYDSGGYHVKPLDSMVLMKKDMAGAAALAGAFELVARRKTPVQVTCLLGLVENMVSERSFRPGDILETRIGKTVEIRSTDAEGRLVLTDILTYASEKKPDSVIDMATLTGAVVRFMGPTLTPVSGQGAELMRDLVEAGAHSHERLVHIPLLKEHRESTRAQQADLRNWGTVDGFNAGSMAATGFLSHFVGDVPWAHVDMSNASWSKSDHDAFSLGGTGFGVRLVTEYLETLAERGRAKPKAKASRKGKA